MDDVVQTLALCGMAPDICNVKTTKAVEVVLILVDILDFILDFILARKLQNLERNRSGYLLLCMTFAALVVWFGLKFTCIKTFSCDSRTKEKQTDKRPSTTAPAEESSFERPQQDNTNTTTSDNKVMGSNKIELGVENVGEEKRRAEDVKDDGPVENNDPSSDHDDDEDDDTKREESWKERLGYMILLEFLVSFLEDTTTIFVFSKNQDLLDANDLFSQLNLYVTSIFFIFLSAIGLVVLGIAVQTTIHALREYTRTTTTRNESHKSSSQHTRGDIAVWIIMSFALAGIIGCFIFNTTIIFRFLLPGGTNVDDDYDELATNSTNNNVLPDHVSDGIMVSYVVPWAFVSLIFVCPFILAAFGLMEPEKNQEEDEVENGG